MNCTFCDMKTSGPLWRLHTFGEEFYPPGQPYWWVNRNREWPANVNIQYTLKGVLRYVQDGLETPVHAGQACLYTHQDGSEYGVLPEDAGYGCIWISLAGAGLPEHWNQIRSQYGSVISDCDGRLLPLIRQVIQAGSFSGEQDPLTAADAVHHFVTELMRLLARCNDRSGSPADRALARLRANPLYPWSLKELTAEEGCSREHFCRVFRSRYKTTPAAWLSQQRIEHARYLLQTTKLTVDEIARQSGLSGSHSLARALRRLYRQGPQAIRRRSGRDI